MASGLPADLPLAMLANGGTEHLPDILQKANSLRGSERQNTFSQMLQLSGLRSLDERLIMELNSMVSTTDPFLRIHLVKDLIRNGQAKMLRGQLKVKFDGVPKWVDEKLESATSIQVERWSKKILTAETLEGVLGKK